MRLEKVNIEQVLEELKDVFEREFNDGNQLKGVIEKRVNKFGIKIFYYDGSNAINTLGGDVNLFLNNSQTDVEVLVGITKALDALTSKRKE